MRDESGRIAGMFCAVAETTGKVLAEQRQRFVVTLGDTLADLGGPVALTSAAAALLGQHLGVGRAGYGEIDATDEIMTVDRDWTDGSTASLAGEARMLDTFGPDVIAELRAGRTLVVEDCLSDPRTSRPDYLATWESIGTRALIVAPLADDGRLVAILFVHSAIPRAWSELEARLVEDVGGRTWAAVERTRAEAALRESEAALAAEVEALGRLQEVSTRLVGTEAPEAVYDAILSAATDLMGSECASIQMLDASGNLQLLAHRGYDRRSVDFWQTVSASSSSTCGVALTTAQRVIVSDVENRGLAPDGGDLKPYRWTGMRAYQSATPRAWTSSEEGLFREAAERVKAAIERARSEDRLRDLNDTLERRVAEALAERNMLLKLVEMADVMIMAIDLDYNILALNAANADEFERIYGVRPKVGDNMLGLLAMQPKHREQVRIGWAQGVRAENATFVEDYGDPDRVRPYYEVNFRPLKNEAGEQIGVYQFVIDVTERVHAAAELAMAQDALRQSQKMEAMGQLTGGVAHDFNNLLTLIVGSLDMLQRRQLGSEREQRLIAGAMQSAERAKTLVQRLLAFARRQPLRPGPVDVPRLVSGMCDPISSTMGPQIRVLVEAPDGLPPAKADPDQLEMALLNLAVNARDAMSEGGGTLRISTTTEVVSSAHRIQLRPGAYLCLSVADIGIGMNAATIARAIEPFFSTKGVGKGTGLGLSMVHGLASQLGGALTIQSHPGLGTNVELWLPCSDVGAESVRQALGASDLPATRGTVLLVDDEEVVRMSIAEMLIELGHAVIEA